MTRHYLIMWDDLGLDSISDLTALQEENVLAILGGNQPISVTDLLYRILLRSRYNSHRNCEVYSIELQESVTIDDIKACFRDNSDAIIHLIKERGNNLQ